MPLLPRNPPATGCGNGAGLRGGAHRAIEKIEQRHGDGTFRDEILHVGVLHRQAGGAVMRMVDARASTILTPNHHFQTMFRDLILDRIFVLNYFRPKFRSNKIKLGPNSGSGGFELRANFGCFAMVVCAAGDTPGAHSLPWGT